eukprot:10163987-Alexandrium_andersonii.AAC.1
MRSMLFSESSIHPTGRPSDLRTARHGGSAQSNLMQAPERDKEHGNTCSVELEKSVAYARPTHPKAQSAQRD